MPDSSDINKESCFRPGVLSAGKNRLLRCISSPLLQSLVLVGVIFAVYSNNYRHDYHLDSGHLLLENTAVRSLKNIPSYFRDPSTLAALRSNIDYRPVLQISYALNYALSRYDTWSWHLIQILLHAACVLGLYAFCGRIMRQFGYAAATARFTSFVAALIFAIHPAESGVVNYLSARSSLLTAAFLFPALLLYLQPFGHHGYARPRFFSAAMYGLALFTKVEAVGALPVFLLYDMLQTARKREASPGTILKDAAKTLNVATFTRLLPHLLVTGIYFLIRFKVMAGYDSGARHDAAVTPLIYFLTQMTAWWHYISIWFAPVNLIADNMNYPVFRSLWEPQVLLALGGWLMAAMLIVMTYSRHPYLFFIVASALCLIAPTSSFAPLAEMVNEHRPYMPMAVLSCAWLIPLLPRVVHFVRGNRTACILAITSAVAILISLSLMTRHRNLVFKSERSYYEDILAKAPSARAYANYGLTYLKEAQYDKALDLYQQALRLAPNWHIIHLNLGLIYQAQGNAPLARASFDRAAATDQYSGTAKIYRGEFLLAQHLYHDAYRDFLDVLPLHRQKYAINKGIATAAAGLGDWKTSISHSRQCFAEDPVRFEGDLTSISRPFWEHSDRWGPGLLFYKKIDSLLPGRWWVHYNIGDLALKCNDSTLAQTEFDRARELKK